MSLSITRLMTVALTLLLASGCNDRGLDMVPVHGRVTFGGEGWERPGLVFFTPAEPAEGYPRRGGMADFDTDGYFKAETFEPNDGLIPGRYVVNLQCWKIPPKMGGPPPVSFIPKKYQHGSTSGFQVEVPAGAEKLIEVEFDVPRP